MKTALVRPPRTTCDASGEPGWEDTTVYSVTASPLPSGAAQLTWMTELLAPDVASVVLGLPGTAGTPAGISAAEKGLHSEGVGALFFARTCTRYDVPLASPVQV